MSVHFQSIAVLANNILKNVSVGSDLGELAFSIITEIARYSVGNDSVTVKGNFPDIEYHEDIYLSQEKLIDAIFILCEHISFCEGYSDDSDEMKYSQKIIELIDYS